MSDPERLAARGGLGGALLRSGRVFDAERARERRQAVIGAGAATATAAAAKAAAPKGLLHLGLGKWIAVSLLAATAVAPIASRMAAPPRPPAPLATPVETASRSPAPPEGPTEAVHVGSPVALPPEPAPATPLASAAPLVHQEPATRVKPLPEAPPVQPSASAAPAPGDELSAVLAARMALRAGQTARTLSLLDDHDRLFPGGKYGSEVELLRIEALSLSGARAEARARAQRFLALHPDSPYAARARVHAEEGGEQKP
jgi:hypothetical protein